jgi:hypothetical protein
MTDTRSLPTHTTSQDDDEVALIATDDYLNRIARGGEVSRDDLSLVLSGWRVTEQKVAADAYDFFCLSQALNHKPRKHDVVGTMLTVLFVVMILGYSASIGLSIHSMNWALVVAALSGALGVVMITVGMVTTPRRK